MLASEVGLLTLKTIVFWRPTRSAKIPIPTLERLFTPLNVASKALLVPVPYESIETEYVVR